MLDLETFHSEFLNDVQLRIATTGGFTDFAFTEVAALHLEEVNEVTSFQACHYRAPTGRIRVDGYAFDDADDSLRVFIVHRAGSDELTTLGQAEIRQLFRRLISFVENAFTGRFEKSIDENHPARDLAEDLLQRKPMIARIRAYLLTDYVLSVRIRDWPEGELDGIPIDYHIWDIGRFYRAYASNVGLDDVVVDFREGDHGNHEGLPCLVASTPGSPYKAFLCVVPAPLLADIYDKYGSRLLEGNVRAFLTAKGKINQGIRRTLLERPEMFFAYNNGVSAVASDVDLVENATGTFLVSARNLQIVNGGQTTASIENAKRVERAMMLGEAFVPMKLSVVAGEQSALMVSDISRFANSQNKVSDADFFANHPFHQRLEQISRRVLAPARIEAQYETRWYYERARGQYLNEFSKLTPAQRDRAKLIMPKSQVITKPDLAKSELSWQGRPHNVSAGTQIFFQEFAKRVDAAWKADPDAFHEEYFKNVVARMIIYRAAEVLVSKADWYIVGYRAIIVTYAVAKLCMEIARCGSNVIDLRRIWRQQEIYPELAAELLSISRDIFDGLRDGEEGQKNLTQWAKRQSCWEMVKHLPSQLSAEFLATLVRPTEAVDDIRAAKAMQVLDSGIDDQSTVLNLGEKYWRAVLDWAVPRKMLDSKDESILRTAAGYAGAFPSEKQCKRLLLVRKHCQDAGFVFLP